jgi:hypothetical protein
MISTHAMDLPDIKKLIADNNPWWQSGEIPSTLALPFRRPLLMQRLMKYLTVDRIVVLKGVRRAGKSTLMFQMAQQLLADGVAPRQIIFVDFEDFRLRHDIHQIIDTLDELYDGKFHEPPVKYLFLDEVHHIEHWESAVKVYFDRKRAVKFIVSGSSSPLVQRGLEALIGRCLEEKILPFSFRDFLLYHHGRSELGEKISQLAIEFENGESLLAGAHAMPSQLTALNIVLASYLRRGGFAHVIEQTDSLLFQRDLREDVVEKIIYRDLAQLYGIEQPSALERLFYCLAGQTAGLLNSESLAKFLQIKQKDLKEYVNYLQRTQLINLLALYSPSIGKSIRSMQKCHVIDSGLMTAFGFYDEAKAIEAAIARHLYNARPFYWRDQYEVDFVVQIGPRLLPIEVKYRENIESEDFRGLGAFMRTFDAKDGILVTKHEAGQKNLAEGTVYLVPASVFLLSNGDLL